MNNKLSSPTERTFAPSAVLARTNSILVDSRALSFPTFWEAAFAHFVSRTHYGHNANGTDNSYSMLTFVSLSTLDDSDFFVLAISTRNAGE